MRSPFYEAALTKQGVKFTYAEKFNLSDVDAKKSLRNQARLGEPLDAELIETYLKAYRDGDQFPPLVVWKPSPARKGVLVDGNQRLAAVTKGGWKCHDAYLIDTKDEVTVDRLTWTFNNLVNGKRLTPEEAVRHAVTFVRKHGYKQSEAAAVWRVPLWKIRHAVSVEEVREALNRQNLKNVSSLPANVLDELSALTPAGEDVLAAAAKVVAGAGLGEKDTIALVHDVKAAATTKDKLKAVETFAVSSAVTARREETAGGRVKNPLPRAKLATQLRTLGRLLEDYPARTLRPSPESVYGECREVAYAVVDKLVEVFGMGSARREAK